MDTAMGSFMHACEGELVCKSVNVKVSDHSHSFLHVLLSNLALIGLALNLFSFFITLIFPFHLHKHKNLKIFFTN